LLISSRLTSFLIHNENPYGRNPTTFKNWSDGASVSSVEINPKEAGRKIYELRKSQNRRAATQLSCLTTT